MILVSEICCGLVFVLGLLRSQFTAYAAWAEAWSDRGGRRAFASSGPSSTCRLSRGPTSDRRRDRSRRASAAASSRCVSACSGLSIRLFSSAGIGFQVVQLVRLLPEPLDVLPAVGADRADVLELVEDRVVPVVDLLALAAPRRSSDRATWAGRGSSTTSPR